jgi:hypothetical protein
MWQSDCEEYRKLRRPFQLRDVGLENERFIELYAARFDFDIERDGSTVTFREKPI